MSKHCDEKSIGSEWIFYQRKFLPGELFMHKKEKQRRINSLRSEGGNKYENIIFSLISISETRADDSVVVVWLTRSKEGKKCWNELRQLWANMVIFLFLFTSSRKLFFVFRSFPCVLCLDAFSLRSEAVWMVVSVALVVRSIYIFLPLTIHSIVERTVEEAKAMASMEKTR